MLSSEHIKYEVAKKFKTPEKIHIPPFRPKSNELSVSESTSPLTRLKKGLKNRVSNSMNKLAKT